MNTASPAATRVISSRRSTWARLTEIFRYRELLIGMIRKDLKVRYKNSFLGFLWTMVNPALYLLVFWLVFTKFLGSSVPDFPLYFLSGLLVWNLFSNGLAGATGSVVGASGIVKKVYFPREILPLSAVGAALVHFFLQGIVLVLAFLIFQHQIDWVNLWALIPALLALLVFSAALGILFSAINVYMRDTQHLLELVLLAWFWMTPVVYAYMMVASKTVWVIDIWKMNPVIPSVLTFQRVLYNRTSYRGADGSTVQILPPNASIWWYVGHSAIVIAISIVLGYVAIRVFDRAEGNFAEEL
ncbi:MAG: ABC transporter permease [Acidimicrobiia bacterium]